ncbi:MAG: asparagine synthase-related protein [Candidatus Aenigmatarchaeota archaeon]
MDRAEKLLELVRRAVERIPQGSAVAFSGGLDSTLIAALAKEPVLYVVGTENAPDIPAAKRAAEALGKEVTMIIVGEEEIKGAAEEIKKILMNIEPTPEARRARLPSMEPTKVSISFNMPLYFVCRHCTESTVVSAQGPDTMLGGFFKYLKMNKEEAMKEMKRDTEDLVSAGYLQHVAIGRHFGKRVVLPYLDKEVIDFLSRVPFEQRIRDGKRKWVLVEAAKLVLSKEIAEREKKSAQYGSGVMKFLRKKGT